MSRVVDAQFFASGCGAICCMLFGCCLAWFEYEGLLAGWDYWYGAGVQHEREYHYDTPIQILRTYVYLRSMYDVRSSAWVRAFRHSVGDLPSPWSVGMCKVASASTILTTGDGSALWLVRWLRNQRAGKQGQAVALQGTAPAYESSPMAVRRRHSSGEPGTIHR